MKTLTHKKPSQQYFCMAVPPPDPDKDAKIDIIHKKETYSFKDPDSGEEYQAELQDMIWYQLSFISEFHANICMQMTARDLRVKLMKNYKMRDEDEVCIVLFKLK